MRKELVIPVVVIIVIAAVGMYWYYGDRDDVKIVDLNGPRKLGTHMPGHLSIILQNNESVPVNVNIDVKNAFVSSNGTSIPTSRLVMSKNPYLANNYADYILSDYVHDYIPLTEEITLMPGENTIGVFLGYVLADNYSVEVKIYQNERLIDKGTIIVEVPLPELLLQLEYKKATTDNFDIYRIDGYITNEEMSRAGDVTTKVTVINDKTGEVVSTDTYDNVVGFHQKVTISDWIDRPMTLIELAHNESSNVSYMPITSVVKGKIGDIYRVNVTSTSQDQVVSAEIVIPPA